MSDSFISRLKALMKKNEIPSQYKLAQLLGIHVNSINNWFTGVVQSPTDRHLQIIARYFQVSPAWLKYGDKKYAPTPKDERLRIFRKLHKLNWYRLEHITRHVFATQGAD